MGTLRDSEDLNYIKGITEEVTNLFGTTATLYRLIAADNETIRDPLYDEPSSSHTVQYHPYVVQCMFFDYNDTPFVTPEGLYSEVTSRGHITREHLVKANVMPDHLGDFISEGDVLQVHNSPEFGTIAYDIIQTTREGWVNDTGWFTGYSFSLKRSTKFIPERKNLNA
jgi:hypothetical protein